MIEQTSEEYKRAEGKIAFVVFLAFVVWCPAYLLLVRPAINAALAEATVTSYPAMLHLIPILGPIVLLALLLGRTLPPKSEHREVQ